MDLNLLLDWVSSLKNLMAVFLVFVFEEYTIEMHEKSRVRLCRIYNWNAWFDTRRKENIGDHGALKIRKSDDQQYK